LQNISRGIHRIGWKTNIAASALPSALGLAGVSPDENIPIKQAAAFRL
jgi:hypothetical protein